MTTPIAYQAERTGGRSLKLLTFAGTLRDAILADLEASTKIHFPSTRYREDPVAFAREILGIEPWSKQIEIMESVRDNDRTAVRSGNKVGKSKTAAMLALWFYASYKDARVILTSVTARQVDEILWREVKMLLARAGRCVECKEKDPDGRTIPRPCPHSAIIKEEPGGLARTGLKSDDFREIFGFTAKQGDAVSGISGGNLLYIFDEASGIPQTIFDSFEGNRAGGARACLISNPSTNEGELYDAFYHPAKKWNPETREGYYPITVSGEETPNAKAGKILIPGLASRKWIEERRREWGEDSALFKIRVQGIHALQEEGRIFSVQAIGDAEERWKSTELKLDEGRLFIGVDPAGSTGTGDESVFALRRGLKVLSLHPMRSLDADGHLVQILDIVRKHRTERDPIPVVVLDKGGEVGSKLFGRLQNYCEVTPGQFELCGLQASDKAIRQPEVYDRMRDLLTANLEDFLRNGGAIPEDAKLSVEMHKMEWRAQTNGKLKVTPKDEIRKDLGRSPDRYDAVALACWTPRDFLADAAREVVVPTSRVNLAEGRDYWESVATTAAPDFVY